MEGRYNDIPTPDVHCIRLASEFSSFGDLMDTFCDECRRQQITEAARTHAMDHHTYAHHAETVSAILTEGRAA